MGHDEEVEAKTPPPLDRLQTDVEHNWAGVGGVRGNFCHFCQYFAHCLTKS